jgi:hypothetical protein
MLHGIDTRLGSIGVVSGKDGCTVLIDAAGAWYRTEYQTVHKLCTACVELNGFQEVRNLARSGMNGRPLGRLSSFPGEVG